MVAKMTTAKKSTKKTSATEDQTVKAIAAVRAALGPLLKEIRSGTTELHKRIEHMETELRRNGFKVRSARRRWVRT
jgi:hypothetical protein